MKQFVRAWLVPSALLLAVLASGCGDNESASGITGKTDASAPPTDYAKQSRGDKKPTASESGKAYPGKAK